MAKEGKKSGTEAGSTAVSTVPEPSEGTYTALEFARNAARLFGEKATADLVTAAFRMEGRETATLSEAKSMMAQFMSREVR